MGWSKTLSATVRLPLHQSFDPRQTRKKNRVLTSILLDTWFGPKFDSMKGRKFTHSTVPSTHKFMPWTSPTHPCRRTDGDTPLCHAPLSVKEKLLSLVPAICPAWFSTVVSRPRHVDWALLRHDILYIRNERVRAFASQIGSELWSQIMVANLLTIHWNLAQHYATLLWHRWIKKVLAWQPPAHTRSGCPKYCWITFMGERCNWCCSMVCKAAYIFWSSASADVYKEPFHSQHNHHCLTNPHW